MKGKGTGEAVEEKKQNSPFMLPLQKINSQTRSTFQDTNRPSARRQSTATLQSARTPRTTETQFKKWGLERQWTDDDFKSATKAEVEARIKTILQTIESPPDSLERTDKIHLQNLKSQSLKRALQPNISQDAKDKILDAFGITEDEAKALIPKQSPRSSETPRTSRTVSNTTGNIMSNGNHPCIEELIKLRTKFKELEKTVEIPEQQTSRVEEVAVSSPRANPQPRISNIKVDILEFENDISLEEPSFKKIDVVKSGKPLANTKDVKKQEPIASFPNVTIPQRNTNQLEVKQNTPELENKAEVAKIESTEQSQPQPPVQKRVKHVEVKSTNAQGPILQISQNLCPNSPSKQIEIHNALAHASNDGKLSEHALKAFQAALKDEKLSENAKKIPSEALVGILEMADKAGKINDGRSFDEKKFNSISSGIINTRAALSALPRQGESQNLVPSVVKNQTQTFGR